MIIAQKNKEVTISPQNWPLAVDLFIKWGYDVNEEDRLEVSHIDDITSELSVWGIPWTRTKWDY